MKCCLLTRENHQTFTLQATVPSRGGVPGKDWVQDSGWFLIVLFENVNINIAIYDDIMFLIPRFGADRTIRERQQREGDQREQGEEREKAAKTAESQYGSDNAIRATLAIVFK